MTAKHFLQLILPTLDIVVVHGYHSAMEMFVLYYIYSIDFVSANGFQPKMNSRVIFRNRPACFQS